MTEPRKTPRTDYLFGEQAHAEYRVGHGAEESHRNLEIETQELAEALDTLTLVVGLTPISGNKKALQEAFDLARAALARHRAKQARNT